MLPTVEVAPAAADFDVRLVQVPGTARGRDQLPPEALTKTTFWVRGRFAIACRCHTIRSVANGQAIMSVMRGLTLTSSEQTRLQVLNQVMGREMAVGDAARLLGLSERHAWRLLSGYRKEGAAALAHGNRNRPPINATPVQVRDRVTRLATTRYQGLNQTHFTELLAEREGIFLARSTVRGILGAAGIASPRRRRPPRHRSRRERMPQEGMLLQLDGSHHRWLQHRGPRFVLMLAIDDATGPRPTPCSGSRRTRSAI